MSIHGITLVPITTFMGILRFLIFLNADLFLFLNKQSLANGDRMLGEALAPILSLCKHV